MGVMDALAHVLGFSSLSAIDGEEAVVLRERKSSRTIGCLLVLHVEVASASHPFRGAREAVMVACFACS